MYAWLHQKNCASVLDMGLSLESLTAASGFPFELSVLTTRLIFCVSFQAWTEHFSAEIWVGTGLRAK